MRHVNFFMKNGMKRISVIHAEVSEHLLKESSKAAPKAGCLKCEELLKQKNASYATVARGSDIQSTNTVTVNSNNHQITDKGDKEHLSGETHLVVPVSPDVSEWQKAGTRAKQLSFRSSRPDAVMIRCKDKEDNAEIFKAVQSDMALRQL